MKRERTALLLVASLVLVLSGAAPAQMLGDWGDAPEGAMAYPFLAPPVLGWFPTCANVGPAGSFIWHAPIAAAHFPGVAPPFDFEIEGNASLCPGFAPYDFDECFMIDGGLIVPDAYTIAPTGFVVPCPNTFAVFLGFTCTMANWGPDIDIMVVNARPDSVFVNVLIDFDQSGTWGGAAVCPTGPAPEHVLVNFPVPAGYGLPHGAPLSALGPPPFLIGPEDEWVWSRFTVSEWPVPLPWDGSGSFYDGETEDYLIEIVFLPVPVEQKTWGCIKSLYR